MSTQTLKAADLQRIGVSKPYAHQIVGGSRKPSVAMALRIMRGTGVKLGPLNGLSDAEVALLEKMHG